jgi:hypothetical protein
MPTIELPFPENEIEPPMPIIDLDEPLYLSEFKALAESANGVYAERSEGRGRNYGRTYYRLSLSKAVVKLNGRLYKGARTETEEVIGDHTDVRVDRWTWSPRLLTYYERVSICLEDHEAIVEEQPDLAAYADAMYRYVLERYDLSKSYRQLGLLKFWFSCYNWVCHHELGCEFKPRLIGASVGEALRTAFGEDLKRWTDIPQSFLEAVKVLAAVKERRLQ